MTIPLVDLQLQYSQMEDDIISRIRNVLGKMQLFLGENVRALEEGFSSFSGARHGIGVAGQSRTEPLMGRFDAAKFRADSMSISYNLNRPSKWTTVAASSISVAPRCPPRSLLVTNHEGLQDESRHQAKKQHC